MSLSIKYLLHCIFAFTTASSLSAQCMKMEYIDDELNKHSQPYKLYFLPDVTYRFQNEEYRLKKVAGITMFNEQKQVFSEKRYNPEGYLEYEKYPNPQGGTILRYYRYRNAHLIVEDSTRYVIYDLKFDSLSRKLIEPVKTDTMLVMGLRKYSADGKLLSIHNKLAKDYNWLFTKSLGFFADSLFFFYDTCGNLLHTNWHNDKVKSSATSDYSFSGLNVQGRNEVHVDNSMITPEYWTFNEKDQLLQIASQHESIQIEYKNDKVSRHIYISNMDPWDKTSSIFTTEYTYDGKGQVIQVLKKFEKENEEKKDKGRKIKIKREKNGLPLTTLDGKELRYTYR